MTSLALPLAFTRYATAAFLAPWIAMRFTAPEGAAGIAETYYKLGGLGGAVTLAVGVGWVLLWIAFVLGFKKTISYALVAIFHAVGTAFTIPWLFPGGDTYNQLFWAAVPVIGAMWLLWALRAQDTFATFKGRLG